MHKVIHGSIYLETGLTLQMFKQPIICSKIKAAEVQYEIEFKRQIEQSNMQVKVKKYGQSVALNQRRSNDFPFFSIKGQDEQL